MFWSESAGRGESGVGFDRGAVTPEDIKRWYQEAVDAGRDSQTLQEAFQRAMQGAGGSLEDLAKLWTEENELKAARAAFHEQLHGKPLTASPYQLTESDEERLRRLVAEYPDLARDALRRLPPSD